MKSFNAVHPTIGAGLALVLGEEGCDTILRGAGRAERRLGMFVGVRQEPSLPWRMLPLFAPGVPGGDESFETLSGARYGRTFALASDRWLIGPLVFKLCTPFWKSSDPAACAREDARLHFAPSIGGFVEYDNTHSEEPVEVIVGTGAAGTAFRPVTGSVLGFNAPDRFGFATTPCREARLRSGNSPFEESRTAPGDYASLVFTIPAREKKAFPFSVGFFDATAAPSTACSFFSGLEDVLAGSLASNGEIVRRADELDSEWFARPETREEKLDHAHAVRAHLAGSVIKRTGAVWTLSRLADDGFGAFDREFFPWAG